MWRFDDDDDDRQRRAVLQHLTRGDCRHAMDCLVAIQANMPSCRRVYVSADTTDMKSLADAMSGNTYLEQIRVGPGSGRSSVGPGSGRSVPKEFLHALALSNVSEVDFSGSFVPMAEQRKVAEKVGMRQRNAWASTELRLSWAKTAHPRLAADSQLVADLPIELIALVGLHIEERYLALFAHLTERQKIFNYKLRQQTLTRRRARLARQASDEHRRAASAAQQAAATAQAETVLLGQELALTLSQIEGLSASKEPRTRS